MGLGVPRETIQLTKINNNLELTQVKDKNINHTQLALDTFKQNHTRLKGIHGVLLKSKSPSCGHLKINVYDQHQNIVDQARGFWSQYLETHFPLIPILDSQYLDQKNTLKIFLKQVYQFKKWNELEKTYLKIKDFNQCLIQEFKPLNERIRFKLNDSLENINHDSLPDLIKQYEQKLFQDIFKKMIQ